MIYFNSHVIARKSRQQELKTSHQQSGEGETAACKLSARGFLMLLQPTVSEQGMVLPTFRGAEHINYNNHPSLDVPVGQPNIDRLSLTLLADSSSVK